MDKDYFKSYTWTFNELNFALMNFLKYSHKIINNYNTCSLNAYIKLQASPKPKTHKAPAIYNDFQFSNGIWFLCFEQVPSD